MRYGKHWKQVLKPNLAEAGLFTLLVGTTTAAYWTSGPDIAILSGFVTVISLATLIWAKSEHLKREVDLQRRRVRYSGIAAPRSGGSQTSSSINTMSASFMPIIATSGDGTPSSDGGGSVTSSGSDGGGAI